MIASRPVFCLSLKLINDQYLKLWGTGFFPPLLFGKGLGVALQRKPRSLRALFFGFQSFEEDWILSSVTLRKGPWSGFTKKTKIALRSVFLVSKVSRRTGFFPPLHFGKGLGVALQRKPRSLCALFF